MIKQCTRSIAWLKAKEHSERMVKASHMLMGVEKDR
jgi:hypothetical protein